MINFGVREVANSGAAPAPGWAYVADTGANSSSTALQPSSRKRARNQLPGHETTAQQDAKIQRHIASLQRDNFRDVSIPIPVRHRDNAGRASHGKGTTATVRKILQSQKTFEHHLDDFINGAVPALPILEAPKPAPATPAVRGGGTPHLTSKGTRSHKKKDPNAVPTPTPLRKVSSAAQLAATPVKTEPSTQDVEMKDVPLLAQGNSTIPAPHPGDSDPLLISRIPGMPSQEEIEKLLAAPPLTYIEARGPLVEEDRRKPPRRFCMNCGYWGRVKCMRCGGRVCALECLQKHQEDCYGRYGA